MGWEFTDDPQTFLDWGAGVLDADPVLATVVASIAHRAVRERDDGVPPPTDRPYWYAVWVSESGRVDAVAMRTAPFAPYAIYLLPAPTGAVTTLAEVLHARDEPISGANGARHEVEEFAAAAAWLQGRRAEVEHHDRLFRLDSLVEPRPASGYLRVADEADLERMQDWFTAFMRDADEQAGRVPGSSSHGVEELDGLRRRLHRTWFWQDGEGRPVNMTGANPPSFGVARVGPVYTPPDARGRGYASAAVAEVSRRILAEGATPCLFTDQANPTSNHMYTALGYTLVVDMLSLRLTSD